MPAAYKQWKRDFIQLFPWQSSRAPLSGPVEVFLSFIRTVPPSYSKNDREAALRGERVCSLGDCDNLAKSCCDALTEIGVWKDDAQVSRLSVEKLYGAVDEIRVRIGVLGLQGQG